MVVSHSLSSRPRVLLIAPRDSYRITPYLSAAEKLGIELQLASEGLHTPTGLEPSGLRIDFNDLRQSQERLLITAREQGWSAVIGTDDASIELAASVSAALGLRHNPPAAVRSARRKDLARRELAAHGVPVPAHWRIDLGQSLAPQLQDITYPCVAKPVALSGSRGVIRANHRRELEQAIARIQTILARHADPSERNTVLVEAFIPGQEVAVEGLLNAERFTTLAIFDKPDPLNGPYFEETYYITPSRHTAVVQEAISGTVARACAAHGLREGPVHAECRINEQGVWVLEVAARTIGGLCGRLLRFGTGYGLEELVLMHVLGQSAALQQEGGGAGVMMIPIPQAGILRRVEGLLAARAVPGIEDVVIDVREGYELVPLPEGSSYLGFIYARADSPAAAEAALRAAHAQLRIVVAPLWRATAG